MTTYDLTIGSSTTYQLDTTIPWCPNTTIWTYPNTIWTTGTHHARKCENCGYCPCCGKSDIPGKLAPAADPED
jgi:hypothetical protein